jgi:hypothetical protein
VTSARARAALHEAKKTAIHSVDGGLCQRWSVDVFPAPATPTSVYARIFYARDAGKADGVFIANNYSGNDNDNDTKKEGDKK